jgi:hypothetical protein
VKSTASKFAKKLDIRGTRGQAVLPPTVHKSGKKYQWHWDGKPVDTRNNTLNTASFSLGQLVAGGALDQSTVENQLMAAATTAGLDSKEITKTIRSGMSAGAKSPRVAPKSNQNRDTCDTIQNDESRQDPPIDKGCDTGGTCDAISEDKKTFALPEPPLDSFPPDKEIERQH